MEVVLGGGKSKACKYQVLFSKGQKVALRKSSAVHACLFSAGI